MISPLSRGMFLLLLCGGPLAHGADFALHTFDRQQLSVVYFSEGANAGDLNHDGKPDVVCGPYWYEGPEFTTRHEIYKPVPQNREGYADNFFSWVYDFSGDGWGDVFVVGFPGTPAYVYENPQAAGGPWKKHRVFDWVSNESPHFTNLVGDERPELVCTRDGFFGFATIDPAKPLDAWTFHPVSEQVTDRKFGHGLGVGDLNGDGRLDIIHAKGWFEQPAADALTSRWPSHAAKFGDAYGGAEMLVYDVDGDGDNDVITSLAAHDFGLAWFEQTRDGEKGDFKPHLIMGEQRSQNRYGVLFSELHSLALADIDGDGLKDIVTGKTYYSHHKGSPLWDAGAVVYWFRLVRGAKGASGTASVDWVPYQADGEAGIGRQVSVADINGDGLLDIVVGGMKGAHVLTHRKTIVDEATWAAAQPKPFQGGPAVSVAGAVALRGPKATLDDQGRAAGAIEGESLKHRVTGGRTVTQGMAGFKADRWSGDAQLFWMATEPGHKLTLELPEGSGPKSGPATLEVVLTCARDYAIVQLALDDQPLGKPIDLYDPTVITTGVLTFDKLDLKPGPHTLSVQVVGANPAAAKPLMVAVDFVRLKAAK